MRKLIRLAGICLAAALVLSGTGVAFAVIGDGVAHHAASAQELVLPPISSELQEGSTVYADDGHTVLAVLSGPQYRVPVDLSQVSKTMIAAVLDTEDHGFYVHGGFDVSSMVRAAVADSSGSGLQGGSTIPQQLVKQLYLTPARKLSRKIKEAVLADRLEQKYTKNQILQAYLNTVYLGNGAYGVQAAAEVYFDEPASKLDLAQSALLAGMIQDPNGYDPVTAPAAARDRRSQVLGRMVVYHDITAAQEAAANATPLPGVTPPPVQQDTVGNYYVQEVRNQLLAAGSPLGDTYAQRYQALFEGGLKIYTNLDPTLQAAAEQAVTTDTPANNGGFEEGLVSIDPGNGDVRALVGGTGTANSQFDIMTQGLRQPGSGFKLFTLVSALEQGYSVYDTVDSNAPCAIKFPGNSDMVKTPIHNDSGPGGGPITVVTATADSVNCAYIRLAHEVGLANVVATAKKMGISEMTPADAYIPSMVIGSVAVKPIEMAAAYATLANGGTYHAPQYISQVVDRSGGVIYSQPTGGTRIFSTQVAAEADVAFRAVVQYGTGTAAALYNRPVAGKTGTTNNNVDAWFNGFTPQQETTVWIGNLKSDAVPIVINGVPVYGADYPARTWHDYSAAIMAGQPVIDFPGVSGSELPPTKYITSPSLVADDVLAHNGVYNGYGSNGYGYGYSPTSVAPAGSGAPVPGGTGPSGGGGSGGGPGSTGPPTSTGTPTSTGSGSTGTGSTGTPPTTAAPPSPGPTTPAPTGTAPATGPSTPPTSVKQAKK